MRPTGPFVAERVAAQHCPELLRGTRQAADPLKELARLGQRLPELLELHFGTLCAGARAEVRVGEPVEMQAGAVSDKLSSRRSCSLSRRVSQRRSSSARTARLTLVLCIEECLPMAFAVIVPNWARVASTRHSGTVKS